MSLRTRPVVVPFAAAFLPVFAFAASASADQVDLGADHDTTIYEDSASTANGAGDYLFAGRSDQPKIRRSLLHFDLAASVPAGATITSATLTLYCSRTKTQNQNLSLHRVLQSWGEGASNAPNEEGQGTAATVGDATWGFRFFNTLPWTTAGGDFAATTSATTAVGGQNTFYSWTSAGMVADLQAWLDGPAQNYGWILRGNEAAQKVAKRFDSRTHPDASKRPLLHVVFTPPAGQTGACCAADGGCGVVVHPGAACGGAYAGAGTTCNPNVCPQPTGACCLPVSGATCSTVTSLACASAGGQYRGALTSCAPNPCEAPLTPFIDALPRPAVATPKTGTAGGVATYELSIVEMEQKLHSELPPTRVWGFSDGKSPGTFPGPTLEASTDKAIDVTWRNDLRDYSTGALRTQHYLPVEECLTDGDGSSPRTVIHLHGGHVPPAADGYPSATFLPGQQTKYTYPNHQDAATLWYHDHAFGITRLNVYMGLAGFYLLRTPAEQLLGLPAGEFEIPLAVQDRTFRADGSLSYPSAWAEHFVGEKILVNGKVWPYLDVKQGKYRFRILNGSNARAYTLSLSDGASFQQIGSDGGLLAAPVTLTELPLAPGERADVVLDFAGYAVGTEVLLQGADTDVMKLRVIGGVGHTAPLPAVLRAIAPPSAAAAVTSRDFTLDKSAAACGGAAWRINGLDWTDISEKPKLGTSEIWRFINTSGAHHPMHMHLVQFQILDRQPLELVGGNVVPLGSPALPAPGERGFKDTVNVMPNEIVRVIARFEDYVGKYPYHCHVLEHEDNMMMRQFETTTQCGDAIVSKPIETCDPPSSCPTTCDDGNPCTTDTLVGSAATCTAACEHAPIAACAPGSDGGTPPADAGTGAPDASDAPDASEADGGGDGAAGSSDADAGCGCHTASTGSGEPLALLAGGLAMAVLGLRRRARGETSRRHPA